MRTGMAAATVAMLAAGAACGRVGFGAAGALGGDGDAAIADGDSAGLDAAPCDSITAFTNPHPIAELASTFDDWGAAISGDALTIYYDSGLATPATIVAATRASRTAPFGAPAVQTALALPNGDDESDSTITADGLEIFMDDDDDMTCPYHAQRAAVTDTWSTPAQVTSLCGQSAGATFVTGDGLALTYTSGSTFFETTRATRADSFVPGVMIGGSMALDTCCLALTSDGKVGYFGSEIGATMLYVATRASPDVAFTDPAVELSDVNTAANNADPVITADGHELLFSSDITGHYQLWTATAVCP